MSPRPHASRTPFTISERLAPPDIAETANPLINHQSREAGGNLAVNIAGDHLKHLRNGTGHSAASFQTLPEAPAACRPYKRQSRSCAASANHSPEADVACLELPRGSSGGFK